MIRDDVFRNAPYVAEGGRRRVSLEIVYGWLHTRRRWASTVEASRGFGVAETRKGTPYVAIAHGLRATVDADLTDARIVSPTSARYLGSGGRVGDMDDVGPPQRAGRGLRKGVAQPARDRALPVLRHDERMTDDQAFGQFQPDHEVRAIGLFRSWM